MEVVRLMLNVLHMIQKFILCHSFNLNYVMHDANVTTYSLAVNITVLSLELKNQYVALAVNT